MKLRVTKEAKHQAQLLANLRVYGTQPQAPPHQEEKLQVMIKQHHVEIAGMKRPKLNVKHRDIRVGGLKPRVLTELRLILFRRHRHQARQNDGELVYK